jgi:cell division protein FtsB
MPIVLKSMLLTPPLQMNQYHLLRGAVSEEQMLLLQQQLQARELELAELKKRYKGVEELLVSQ